MTSPEALAKSLRFMLKIQDGSDASQYARGILWDQDSQPLATGEISAEPSLAAALRGQFQPDDAALLDTLQASAKFLSMGQGPLVSVLMGEIHRGDPLNRHLHFEVFQPLNQSKD